MSIFTDKSRENKPHIWDDNGFDKSRIWTGTVVRNFEALPWHSPREGIDCSDRPLIRVSETYTRDSRSSRRVCSLLLLRPKASTDMQFPTELCYYITQYSPQLNTT
jgi:hypothetical protein